MNFKEFCKIESLHITYNYDFPNMEKKCYVLIFFFSYQWSTKLGEPFKIDSLIFK